MNPHSLPDPSRFEPASPLELPSRKPPETSDTTADYVAITHAHFVFPTSGILTTTASAVVVAILTEPTHLCDPHLAIKKALQELGAYEIGRVGKSVPECVKHLMHS